jgi:hypothetical protein
MIASLRKAACATAMNFSLLIRTGFGFVIVTFLTAQVVFIVCATRGWLPALLLRNGVEQALTAFLVVSINLLVTVNTLIIILKMTPIMTRLCYFNSMTADEDRDAKRSYLAFVLGLHLATVTSACLFLLALLAWCEVLIFPWVRVLEINEYLCVPLFGFFLVANLCCRSICKTAMGHDRAMTDATKQQLQREIAELDRIILAVDIPGMIGILSIWGIGVMIYPSHVTLYYFHGFATGAISLHIAFSQTALALICVFGGARHGPVKGEDVSSVRAAAAPLSEAIIAPTTGM